MTFETTACAVGSAASGDTITKELPLSQTDKKKGHWNINSTSCYRHTSVTIRNDFDADQYCDHGVPH